MISRVILGEKTENINLSKLGSIIQIRVMISINSGYHREIHAMVQGSVSQNFDQCLQWKIMRKWYLWHYDFFSGIQPSITLNFISQKHEHKWIDKTHSPGKHNFLSFGVSTVSICWIQLELSRPNLSSIRPNMTPCNQ